MKKLQCITCFSFSEVLGEYPSLLFQSFLLLFILSVCEIKICWSLSVLLFTSWKVGLLSVRVFRSGLLSSSRARLTLDHILYLAYYSISFLINSIREIVILVFPCKFLKNGGNISYPSSSLLGTFLCWIYIM